MKEMSAPAYPLGVKVNPGATEHQPNFPRRSPPPFLWACFPKLVHWRCFMCIQMNGSARFLKFW